MTRVIPEPGEHPNAVRDAQEVFKVLQDGGVVILPVDVGYGILASSAEGIERAFAAKKRKPGHTLGVVGTWQQHRQLHDLPDERFEMTRVLAEELECLFAVIAPYKHDHPRLKEFSDETLKRITKNDTLGIALGVSPLHKELGRLNDECGQLMVGSSANLTGAGQKFRFEDIEDEVKDAADLIVDYGLQRYYRYGRGGTILDIANLKVVRFGAAYGLIRWRLRKWVGLDLPEDPEHKTDDVSVGVSIMAK